LIAAKCHLVVWSGFASTGWYLGEELVLNRRKQANSLIDPDSSGFFSPHWSPDGRHIAAITKAHRTLMLFDLTTQKWTQAYGYEMGWEHWSHDGKYIYFLDYHDPEEGFRYRVVRLRLNDLKIENIVDIKNVGRLTNGTFAAWFGLAPDDSPLFCPRYQLSGNLFARNGLAVGRPKPPSVGKLPRHEDVCLTSFTETSGRYVCRFVVLEPW
jgi:hypothetical protein